MSNRPRFFDRLGSHTGRVCVRAITDDDVEEDHRRLRVARFLHDAAIAQRRVNHRVQPSHGELILAQINSYMPHALVGIGHPERLIHRSVGIHIDSQVFEDQLRLVAEGAAAEESPEIFLLRFEAPLKIRRPTSETGILVAEVLQRVVRVLALGHGRGRGQASGFFHISRRDRARRADFLRVAAEEQNHRGLVTGLDLFQHFRGHLRCGRLGN